MGQWQVPQTIIANEELDIVAPSGCFSIYHGEGSRSHQQVLHACHSAWMIFHASPRERWVVMECDDWMDGHPGTLLRVNPSCLVPAWFRSPLRRSQKELHLVGDESEPCHRVERRVKVVSKGVSPVVRTPRRVKEMQRRCIVVDSVFRNVPVHGTKSEWIRVLSLHSVEFGETQEIVWEPVHKVRTAGQLDLSHSLCPAFEIEKVQWSSFGGSWRGPLWQRSIETNILEMARSISPSLVERYVIHPVCCTPQTSMGTCS